MKIKNILAMLCASLVLLPSVTWTMEQTEEEQMAIALAASAEEQELYRVLPQDDEELRSIREEGELAEALRISEFPGAEKYALPTQKSREECDFEQAVKASQESTDLALAKKLNAENAVNIGNLSEEEQMQRALEESTKPAKPKVDALINKREEARKRLLKQEEEQKSKSIQDTLNKRNQKAQDAKNQKKPAKQLVSKEERAAHYKTALVGSFDNMNYISRPGKNARSYNAIIAAMKEHAEDQEIAMKLHLAHAINRRIKGFMLVKIAALNNNTLKALPGLEAMIHESCVLGTESIGNVQLKDAKTNEAAINWHITQFLAKPILQYFVELKQQDDKFYMEKECATFLNTYLQAVTRLGVLLLTNEKNKLVDNIAKVVEELTKIKNLVTDKKIKEQLEVLILAQEIQ